MSDTSFLQELQRRNVFRVATVYAVGSFVVLQLADILLPALALANEDIRYVLGALVLGFPLVVTLAWFFELTPEGLKRTTEVEDEASITRTTGRRIDRIAIVLLSLAVVFLLLRSVFVGEPEPDTVEVDDGISVVASTPTDEAPATPTLPEPEADDQPSVAVLPLVNMSSDVENEHFADGLTEELLNALAQNPNLRVAARTSSFYYKGRNENLQTVGEALGVDHILEGSVRRSGERIRITVQLIKTADGFHLWSKTFDRELLDVFAVQDEISAEVARAMEVTLTPEDPRIAAARSTDVTEAWELYLRATEALYTREEAQVEQALAWFREASALDPGYGPPLLGIAEAALVMENNYGSLDTLEADGIAREALERASALGFETARYWGILGLAESHLVSREPDRYELAVAAFEKSLDLSDNNAIVYTWYSTLILEQPGVLTATEKVMAAQRRRHLLERALTLDPLNRVTETNYLNELWRAGEQEEFWTRAEERLARDPDYPTAHYQLAWTRYGIGELAEATRIFVESPTGMPSTWAVLNLLSTLDEDDLRMTVAENTPEDAQEYEDVQYWLESLTDPIEAIRTRAEAMLSSPLPDPRGQSIAQRLLREGDYALTRRLIEHAFPTLREEIPRTRGDTNILAMYAKILYLAGDVPRAREMADYSLAQNRGKPAAGPGSRGSGDLINYLVLGRHEDAIEELQALEAAGYRFWYAEEFDVDPLLDPIRNDPRVQAVREAIDVALAAERDACLALLTEHGYI